MQNKTIHIFHFCSHFELVMVNSNTLPIRCRCWHQWVHYLSIIAAVTIVSLRQKRPKIQIQLLITIYVKLSIFWRLYEIKWREWRVVDESTTDVPAYNTFQHVNSKLGPQHTKAALAAALSPIMSLLYPPNPWCEWCDEWRLTTTLGSTSPTLSEQWCEFFYVPQEPGKCKCCETGPTVFRPYPRRLESLTVCRCHYKGSTFFSVI